MVISRSSFVKFLLNLTYFFILFNAVLLTFGIQYSYFVFFCLIIVMLGFGKYRISSLKLFSPTFLYIFIIYISLSFTVFFLEGGRNSFIAFGLYTLPVLVWGLVYTNVSSIKFENLYCSSLPLTFLVGFIGIYQYFISPTLHGLIPQNSMAINWADGKAFAEYSIFFRATSTLGSPQVFGLFCALNLILTIRYKNSINPLLFYIGFIALGIGGALSGNKSFYLIVALYLVFTYAKEIFCNLKSIILIVAFSSIFVVNLNSFLDDIPMLKRIFSLEEIVKQEQQSDGRLSRYSYIIKNANPIVGEGLGKVTNQSSKQLKAAESYFLKIYYEAGFFALTLILLICSICYVKSRYFDIRDSRVIALTFLGMIIVHAFESPAFFLVWGHMLGALTFYGQDVGNQNRCLQKNIDY